MIYFQLFYEFFKIGLFTFGGGYAMIPIVKETVTAHTWLTENSFYDLLGICECTPGPIAINMATFIGSRQAGFLGSAAATFGVVLPSFLIILFIAIMLKNIAGNKYFKGFISGVKPVVTALIVSAGLILLLKNIEFISGTGINIDFVSVLCFAAVAVIYYSAEKRLGVKLSSVTLVLISSVLGIVFSVFSK